MATATTDTVQSKIAAPQLLKRVLVGVDGSVESMEAARQAALLLEPGGTLTVLGAWTVPPPIVGGLGTLVYSHEVDAVAYRAVAEEAVSTVDHALEALASPATEVVRGFAWDELIKEAEAEEAMLMVVGSHGRGRVRGILIGSTATEVVHKAPCSVLVTRQAEERFPRRIVVGIDGSPQSAAAFAVAGGLAERFGAELWPVVAHGGKGVDNDAVAQVVDSHHEDLPDEPVPALVAASADADLVVVGSRGLHGLKALGSVSERVAHHARCSTLIVRGLAGAEGGSR
jgi:nucleotide-binding universal stress UspA family protein